MWTREYFESLLLEPLPLGEAGGNKGAWVARSAELDHESPPDISEAVLERYLPNALYFGIQLVDHHMGKWEDQQGYDLLYDMLGILGAYDGEKSEWLYWGLVILQHVRVDKKPVFKLWLPKDQSAAALRRPECLIVYSGDLEALRMCMALGIGVLLLGRSLTPSGADADAKKVLTLWNRLTINILPDTVSVDDYGDPTREDFPDEDAFLRAVDVFCGDEQEYETSDFTSEARQRVAPPTAYPWKDIMLKNPEEASAQIERAIIEEVENLRATLSQAPVQGDLLR